MKRFTTAFFIAFAFNTAAAHTNAAEVSGMGAHKCQYLISNWTTPGLRDALIDWANGFVSGLSYGANLPSRGFTYNNIEIMALEAMNGCAVEPASVFVKQFTDILEARLR